MKSLIPILLLCSTAAYPHNTGYELALYNSISAMPLRGPGSRGFAVEPAARSRPFGFDPYRKVNHDETV